MLPLSRFLISFNTNILILKGKSALLQFLHYCLPKINEVLFSKMDTGEVRWAENDTNPMKKFLKTNHLPKSLKMETTCNFCFIYFSEYFQTEETLFFLRKLPWSSAWRKKRRLSWKQLGVFSLTEKSSLSSDVCWRTVDEDALHVLTLVRWCL